MKFRILILFSFLFSLASSAQFSPQLIGGSPTTRNYVRGVLSADSGTIVTSFQDTSIANRGPNIKKTHGLMIKVYDTLFVRDTVLKRWVKFAQNSGSYIDSVKLVNGITICSYKGVTSSCYTIDTSLLATNYYVTNAITNLTTYFDSSINNAITINNYNTFGIDSSTRLITGSVVIDSGFVGHSTALYYKILGRFYNAPYTPFTITNSNPSQDRYTIIYADTLGNVGMIDGAYGSPASQPFVDPESQILVAIYFIPASSTTPQGVSNIWVYREAVEWANLRGTVSTGYDSAYTINPYAGLLSLRIPTQISGQYFEWTDGLNHNATDFAFLNFYLRLNATFNKNTKWGFTFYKDSSIVTSNTVILQDGQFGYSRATVAAYQAIAIPFSQWNFIAPDFNKIRITAIGNGGASYQIDDVKLQAGGSNVSGGNFVETVNGQVGPNVIVEKVDTFYTNADTTLDHYVDKRTGKILFSVPTRLNYFVAKDSCTTIDSLGNKTYAIGINRNCLGGGNDSAYLNAAVYGSTVHLYRGNGDSTVLTLPAATSGGITAIYAGIGLEKLNDSTLKLADSIRLRLNRIEDSVITHNLRIGSNTANIATNTTNIATNTTNIATNTSNILLKFNISDTANKWVNDVYARNDSVFKFKNGTETFVSTAGGTASLGIGYGLDTLTGGTLIVDTTSSNGIVGKPRLTNALSLKENVITPPNSIKYYLNGYKQFVAFNTDSITEGSNNLWYTNTRARASISLTTTGTGAATYDNTTGILNVPTPGGGGGGTVTTISSGNLSPLFTTNITNPTSTPALAFTLSNAAAYTNFGNRTSGSTTPTFFTNPFPDSLKISADSIYQQVNGVWNYQFRARNLDTSFLQLVANSIGSTTQVKNKGLWLSNRTTGSNQFSPAIYFEGTHSGGIRFARQYLTNSNMLWQGSSDSVTWYNSIFFKMSSGGVNSQIQMYSNSGASSGVLIDGSGSISNLSSITSAGALTYNIPAALGGTSGIIYGHRFTGGMRPTSGTPRTVYMAVDGTINWVTGGGTGNYEGLRVNITESSVPAGVNHLFRAGTGGATFLSKFDITSTGQVGIGDSLPDASAKLIIKSTTQGFLLPRMTLTNRDAISGPAKALQVYDTTVNQVQVYNGTNWTGGVIVSSAGTLTLKHGEDYIFTGTTTTWTLPAVSATVLGRNNGIYIKNRGSGTITLNSNAGSTLYDTAAQSTINVTAGQGVFLLPDGTYFNVTTNY